MIARILVGVACLLFAVPAFAQERIGTSRADTANLDGAFVVHNPTGATVQYQVRWGNGEWTRHSLAPNSRRTHSHALSSRGTAPAPQVRFDSVAGDRRTTYRTQEVAFGRVGYTGFGPMGSINNAVHYEFDFDRGGRQLELNRR